MVFNFNIIGYMFTIWSRNPTIDILNKESIVLTSYMYMICPYICIFKTP